MIGIIVSGHGQFASGVYSSIKLIAGLQEKFVAIDFEEGMSAETLHHKMDEAIDSMETMSSIAILTDIPGGTPFNEAVKISMLSENVKVLSGTNVPLVLDSLFKRDMELDNFCESILSSGKSGIKIFSMDK